MTPADVLPPDETPDEAFPIVLTTGRLLEHWHTGSMTRRASVLDALEPEPEVHMAPETLQSLQVKAGDLVRVVTRRGEIELAARIDPKLPSGMIFVPFCFYEAPANYLTNPALDPTARFRAEICRCPDRGRAGGCRRIASGRTALILPTATPCRIAVISQWRYHLFHQKVNSIGLRWQHFHEYAEAFDLDYRQKFRNQLNRLKSESRYRHFVELERLARQAPPCPLSRPGW